LRFAALGAHVVAAVAALLRSRISLIKSAVEYPQPHFAIGASWLLTEQRDRALEVVGGDFDRGTDRERILDATGLAGERDRSVKC
jgi:hypothetical protein